MVFTVYISYSKEDRHLADTLYSILKQNQINVWAIENEHLNNINVFKDIKGYMERSDLILFLFNEVNINLRNVISEYAQKPDKLIELLGSHNYEVRRDAALGMLHLKMNIFVSHLEEAIKIEDDDRIRKILIKAERACKYYIKCCSHR